MARVAPVRRNMTFVRMMLPCPRPVPMSRSIVLFIHPGQRARVAPVMRKVLFLRIMLPGTGPSPTRLLLVLLILSAREAQVVRLGQWRMFPGIRWLCYLSAGMVIEGHWSIYGRSRGCVVNRPPVVCLMRGYFIYTLRDDVQVGLYVDEPVLICVPRQMVCYQPGAAGSRRHTETLLGIGRNSFDDRLLTGIYTSYVSGFCAGV